MKRLAAALTGLAALAACEAPTPVGPTDIAVDVPVRDIRFAAARFEPGVARSNAQIVQDFLDLAFSLESGGQVFGLLRYEGPVRVYLAPGRLDPYRRDLADVVTRLRAEAGIDISVVRSPTAAQIIIEGVPFREIQREAPGAACFVKAGETGWRDFRRKPDRARTRWTEQQQLSRAAIFIASDIPPQDIRSCLNEEIAQALGPANDLYRLADSVFNDDNTHVLLTSFDMTVLRALYDDGLRSGLTRGAVARRLPAILSRVNPRGEGAGRTGGVAEDALWNGEIARALTRLNPASDRLRAANRAVERGGRLQPVDHRLAVALMTRARLIKDSNPQQADNDYSRAYKILGRQVGSTNLRTAQAALHVALGALERRDIRTALDLSTRAIPVAQRHQDAILLSSLYGIQSRALQARGDLPASREARLKYLQWARFAYGDGRGRRLAQARVERALTGE